MSRLDRIKKTYTACALLLFNALVVLVALNLVIFAILGTFRWVTGRDLEDPVTREYGKEGLQEVYPDLSAEQIRELLLETWARDMPVEYEPFTQFREREYSGTYVNVDAAGFRHSKDQAPWPPDPEHCVVFTFGGSTTFGYGLPDDQTFPSYLQPHLQTALGRKVSVYNFGRCFYFSLQERVLLEQLLLEGFVPDLAVFVDGLNEFYFPEGRPHYSKRLARYMEERAKGGGGYESSFLKELPVSQLIRGIRKAAKQAEAAPPVRAVDRTIDPSFDVPDLYRPVVDRYLRNRELTEKLADSHGILAVFVWQPIPTYQYDLSQHLFFGEGFETLSTSHFGYAHLDQLRKERPPGPTFFWCADLQQGLDRPLYVDKYHYVGELCDRLAARVTELLVERDLVSRLSAR